MSFATYKFRILRTLSPFEELNLGEIAIAIPSPDFDAAVKLAESSVVSADASIGKFRLELVANTIETEPFSSDLTFLSKISGTALTLEATKIVASIQQRLAITGSMEVYFMGDIVSAIIFSNEFLANAKVDSAVSLSPGRFVLSLPCQVGGKVDEVDGLGLIPEIRQKIVVDVSAYDLPIRVIGGDINSTLSLIIGANADESVPIAAPSADKISMSAVFSYLIEYKLRDFDDLALNLKDSAKLTEMYSELKDY